MQYTLILILMLIQLIVHSQSADKTGKIALSIVMPENVDELTESQLSKLESKILQITEHSGLAGVGYNTNFVIYPKFALYNTEVVEAGMQNITVVTADLSIYIKELGNNIVFSSISKTLKGSGKNQETAITNALSNISVQDKDFQQFVEKGKFKIIQYYESKCSDIQMKAASLSKMQKYVEVLGLLMSVPEEVGCYSQILEQSIDIYKSYQIQNCKEMILHAKAELEGNHYQNSLHILTQIDPSSPCATESLSLLKSAGSKVDAEEKRNWDFAMRAYSDGVALEKMRISAIKEIAVAYYQSLPSSVNYLYIIK